MGNSLISGKPSETGAFCFITFQAGGDMANEKKLTEKQKRFCEEYLIDLNAAKAAERAGYKNSNIGRQLITKNNVSEYIFELQKRQQRRTEITADRVLEELAAIAFSDRTKISQVTGKQEIEFTPTEILSETEKRAIAGIAYGKNGIEVKSYDKLRALELIGKHIGMFGTKDRTDEDMVEDDGFLDALNGSASDDWSDGDE